MISNNLPLIRQGGDKICDFCDHPLIAWWYETLDTGRWAACDTCHNLIENKDFDTLLNRAMDKLGFVLESDVDILSNKLTSLHKAFTAGCCSPPTPIVERDSMLCFSNYRGKEIVYGEQHGNITNAKDIATMLDVLQATYRNIRHQMGVELRGDLYHQLYTLSDILQEQEIVSTKAEAITSGAVIPAHAVYWNENIWDAAINGYKKARGVTCILPEKPLSIMFWSWSKLPKDADTGMIAIGMFVHHIGDDLYYGKVLLNRRPLYGETSYTIQWSRLRNKTVLDNTTDLIVYMAYKFLLLPCVKTPAQGVSHKEAKRLRKKKKPIPQPYKVVEFHSVRQPSGSHEGFRDTCESEGHRIYSCSYPVSGHWRNQWYPSKAQHEIIWIDTFISGDRTKPLKISNTVFKVTRIRK